MVPIVCLLLGRLAERWKQQEQYKNWDLIISSAARWDTMCGQFGRAGPRTTRLQGLEEPAFTNCVRT